MSKQSFIIFLLFLLTFGLTNLKAQQHEIDSLESLLTQLPERDSSRVLLLNKLSFKLWYTAPRKMLDYAQEARTIAQEIGFSKGENQSLRNMGVYYWAIETYDSSITFHKMALALAKERKDEIEISHSYNNLALVYSRKGAFYETIEAHQQALKLREQRQDSIGMSISLLNIGVTYYLLEDYDKALKYYQQSLNLKKVVKDSLGIGLLYNNLGIAYDDSKEQYDSALYYYDRAIEIYTLLGYGDELQDIYEDIGSLYLGQGNLEKSLEYLTTAIKMSDKNDEIAPGISARNHLGALYIQRGNYTQALKYLQEALQKSKQANVSYLLDDTYITLAKAYEGLSQFKKAYEYQVKYKSLSDSLLNKEEIQRIERLQNKYEFEKEKDQLKAEQERKELEYQQELERQQWIQYSSFAGIVFILIIAGTIYRFYQIKKEDNKQLVHQADMLRLKNEELNVMREKEQEMMQKEREYMEENIANKERQLATTTMLSHEKNSLLNQLLGQMKKVKEKTDETAYQELKEAEKLIQQNLNMKNSWESFVFQFENVHPNFFKKIKEMYQDITPTELKIAAYIKIGFNNKEVAEISNITPDAVKKRINRLKKRMGLGPDDEVRDFVAKI